MKGGALSYNNPYAFKTIDELKKSKDIQNTKNLQHAVFVVDVKNTTTPNIVSEISDDQMKHVIGASWYAVLKLIHDIETLKQTELTENLKNFVQQFFTIDEKNTKKSRRFSSASVNTSATANTENGTNPANVSNSNSGLKDPNAGKKLIIGYIHGLYSYFLVNAEEGEEVPDLSKDIVERYEWVMNKLKEHNTDLTISYDEIWNHLKGHLGLKDIDRTILQLYDTHVKDFTDLINAKEQIPGPPESVISYNINDIAFQQGYKIHDILLKYQNVFSDEGRAQSKHS